MSRITSASGPIGPMLQGALVVWAAWLLLMWHGNHWHLFSEGWFMSVTMALGSFIAGATSEGGGAVAFPVMTLVFDIEPATARDFSLMIQSVGMTAASYTIIRLGIPVEWRAVIFAAMGGALGVILSLEYLSPLLPPAQTKLFFVSTWVGFAAALFWINRIPQRETHARIQVPGSRDSLLLFLFGFVGGCISGLVGSGLDIITFSLLVLAFRVCEKVATPTSVILMASNSLVAFAWKELFGPGMAADAWAYWYVCVPIVVIGAPLGALFIRNKSREFVARFLYISIAIQYLWALIVIPMNPVLAAFSLSMTTLALLFFGSMAWLGARRLQGSMGAGGSARLAAQRQRPDHLS
ncbi:sulfite exporter TauE/SafE family protein [Thioalkalivibrio paradoxus]|uniref:Probable membrane transporter protein n=1 Tax=Thioalkalivibrio paradoxus ARh 1 TaxID=713585 RepID=W0DG32_9GAMM|nr:sulfite exporter TauE/SafE family protein [Thioalkalivibrio paradoxus]AHE97609.1 hypothetical protein THITH_04310 [Thioalkalivibrio paradoxus ARh 1]